MWITDDSKPSQLQSCPPPRSSPTQALSHWKGPAGCRRKSLQLQLSGHCPCHLPGHGGRRTLPVLAPPVQTRRSECAQPGSHGSSSWRRGSSSDRRASDPQPWDADAAGAAVSGQTPRREVGCKAACPLSLWIHVTRCDLQRAAESTSNRKDIVPAVGAAVKGRLQGCVQAGEGTCWEGPKQH